MKLSCHCGCGRELKRVKQFGSTLPGNYTWHGTPTDKNKKFYNEACLRKWEGLRKVPPIHHVNGDSDDEKVQRAERLF